MKIFFPLRLTYDQIFPSKIKIDIKNIYIIDLIYQKKIVFNKTFRLKDIFKHPSYHHRSVVYIEYSIQNVNKMDGIYLIIIRGMDKESLHRCIQYFENTSSFQEYICNSEKENNDQLIDAQFILLDKQIEIDQTMFMNKILGVDRNGHHFLYLHHEYITIRDYWKILCILNQTPQWYDDNVSLNIVDMNLEEKTYNAKDIFFKTNNVSENIEPLN